MFFQGFLIGLVAGVWLTVLYFIITTRGAAIRAYFETLKKPSAAPEKVPQPKEATVAVAEAHPGPSRGKATVARRGWRTRRGKRLDPAKLSAYGAARYQELLRLVHDEPTAQRLVQYEAGLHPDADIEKSIDDAVDDAVDKVLHDRGALPYQ